MLEPLRRLLRKNAWWIWTHEQKDAFKEFKDAVSKAPVLNYFSKSDQTGGQDDASKDGFGFLLMQHGQPVTYRSGALSMAERKYSQVEK